MSEELNKQITEILGRVIKIETKIDGYNTLRDKLDATNNIACNNEKDIKELQDNNKWLWRTIGAALIMSFIGAFLTWR